MLVIESFKAFSGKWAVEKGKRFRSVKIIVFCLSAIHENLEHSYEARWELVLSE